MNNEIVVSVIMVTYNHEKWIEKALDSVLMQKVNFKYEIIVGDDASTDNTPQILCDYKKKYPDKIRLVLHKKNIGPTKNGHSIRKKMQGKYIAFLEGDDYWTDCNKLQKQVDFLESNSQYIACVHKYNIVDEYENIKHEGGYEVTDYMFKPYSFKNSVVTLNDYQNTMGIPSHLNTVVTRNVYRNCISKYSFIYKISSFFGDQAWFLFLLTHGDMYYLEDNMSAYRMIIKKGASNIASKVKEKNYRDQLYKNQYEMERYLNKHFNGKVDLSNERNNLLIGAVCVCMKTRAREDYIVLRNIIKYSNNKITCIYSMLKVFVLRSVYNCMGKYDKRIKL